MTGAPAPAGPEAADPWAGDDGLPERGSFEDYAAHAAPPLLDREAHAAWDRLFMEACHGALRVEMPFEAIRERARMLELDAPVCHDRRPPRPAPEAVDDGTLADIAEGQVPDLGLLAPDLVLGPWADEPLPRGVRAAAAAVLAFAPLVPPGVSPVERFCRARPRPTLALRQALRAVAFAPPALWRVAHGGMVEPALPLAPAFAPPGPRGPVLDLPAGAPVLGRAVPAAARWFLACALPVPDAPPAGALVRRLTLELYRLRRLDRRVTWEDLLRRRGEVLYRTTCEWIWLSCKDGACSCWPASWADAAAPRPTWR